MCPEEKMAQRVLKRHGLEPPFDLEALVQEYATVEKRLFPFPADGISIGIDGTSKPQIIINTRNPNTRQRFTLAHELGHVIIPWHTGTIISHTKYLDPSFKLEYREMEAEANRFAAELLLPTDWVIKRSDEIAHLPTLLTILLEESGASAEAAFIKIFNILDARIVLAELGGDNKCVRHFKTRRVPYAHTLEDVDVVSSSPFSTYTFQEEFHLAGKRYIAWVFDDSEIEETDGRPWREVLNQILDECDSRELLGSVNAVLPSVYQRNKEKTIEDIAPIVVMAYEGREKYKCIVEHNLFPQYVIKRIKELVDKNKI